MELLEGMTREEVPRRSRQPRQPKLERSTPPPNALQHIADMFQPVADLLSWADVEAPAPSYPALYKAWKEEATEAMETAMQASELTMTAQEEERFEIVKDIAFAALGEFLKHARAVGWSSQTPEERVAHVEALLARPQIPQRTSAWYVQGKEVLTASEFATLFRSPRAVSQMVLSKVLPQQPIDAEQTTQRLACMTCEMGPFDWGIRFEPVVKQILEKRWGATIVESGRLLHPRDPLVAASPDGLITAAADPLRVGRLVEIKCPITRAVGEGIPFEYWCQMQVQMEVTDIDECDYVEVKLESLQAHQTELASGKEADGRLWVLQNASMPGCPMIYAYTEAEKEEREASGYELVETVPWRVEKFVTETVARDRAWFKRTEGLRGAFWADVAKARAGQYTPVESSRPRKAPAAAAAAAGLTVIVNKEGGQTTAAAAACLIVDDE